MSRIAIPLPLTRASTAQDSEPVLTPTDITPGYEYKGGGFSGGPIIRKERSVGSTTPGSSYLQGIPEGLDSIREDGRFDQEPYGPYFSLPTNPTAPTTSLGRRATTKELIKRYELLDSATSDYATDSSTTSPYDSNAQQGTSSALEKKVKGRSPIRQSFRNLLSAIGKKAKGFGKDHSTSGSSKSPYSICLDSPPLPASSTVQKPNGAYLDIPSSPADLSKTSSSGMPACNTPTALHVGPLLHLNKPDTSHHLPVWTSCTATLHSSHILVTWLTSQENPSTFMITLASCADVRSLALNDLDTEERSLLPTQPNTGELKVFELLFEGRGREKFAAYSVTSRASWVSAIWDAVLLCQDRKSSTECIPGMTKTPSENRPHRMVTPQTDGPLPLTLKLDSAIISPSVVSSGYRGDASSVGRSSDASSSGTDSRTTSTGGSTTTSDARSQSMLSPRSLLSPVSSHPETNSTVSPNSPLSSIGFECRTDTSALSPHPSLESRSRAGSPTSPTSLASSRLTCRPASTLPALPTPPLSSPQRFSLYDPPVSRASSATPSRSSPLRTPSSIRCQSPSIMNLSQTSVVKQRLAEIERTSSLASQTVSTPRSSRSRQYSPLPQSPVSLTPTRKSLVSTSLHVDTSTYAEEESIIDSYAESSRGVSPLSVFAGRSDRLTSVPSRQSTVRTRLTEVSAAREGTAKHSVAGEGGGEVCSPTSEYSTDFLSPLPTPQRMPFSSISEVVETLQEKPVVLARSEAGSRHVAPQSPVTRLTRIHEPQKVQYDIQSPKVRKVSQQADFPPFEQASARSNRKREPTAVRQVQHFEDVSSQVVSGPLIFQSRKTSADTVKMNASAFRAHGSPSHLSPNLMPTHPLPHVPPSPNVTIVNEGATTASRTPILRNEAPSAVPVHPSAPPEIHVTVNVPATRQQSPAVSRFTEARHASAVSPVFVDSSSPSHAASLGSKLLSPKPHDVLTHHDNIPGHKVPSLCPSPALPSMHTAPVSLTQKTPLMLALESPVTYQASRIRGPPRPARLTKPPLLANPSLAPPPLIDHAVSAILDVPPQSGDPSCPVHLARPPLLAVPSPTPPPFVDHIAPVPLDIPPQPANPTEFRAPPVIQHAAVAQEILPNLSGVEASAKPSRTGGLFAALRRPRRRSAETSVQPPVHEYQPPASPADHSHMAIAPQVSPTVQVVKEVIVERIPTSPIIQVDEETKYAIQTVQGAMTEIIEHENRNGDQLTGIRTQVDTVLSELRQIPKSATPAIHAPPPAVDLPPPIDVSQITDRLDEMGSTLNVNLPELFGKVEELMKQAAALQNAKSVVVLRNTPVAAKLDSSPRSPSAEVAVQPPSDVSEMPGAMNPPQEQDHFANSVGDAKAPVIEETSEESSATQVDAPQNEKDLPVAEEPTKLELFDPTQLEVKLDALLSLCQQLQAESQSATRAEDPSQSESSTPSVSDESKSPVATGSNGLETAARDEAIQEILELLKNDFDTRITQSDQQTDSVRYLHELNSWLEAFVNHGTSQIDNVLIGVQHLCRELGPIPELQTLQDLSSETAGSQEPPASNLLSDIRKLLVASEEREGNTLALEVSVNGLVAAVQEDLRRNAESRNTLTTESIVGLIERHRQDQERLLRNVASDLSNDIRGERLRFVEAMKEATAINVQIHVEEFKKELTREVLIMTQEVGRLQKERQSLEQQIADLFSFYAKQKQSGSQDNRASPQRISAPPRIQHPRPIPSMRRRPLPTPSPRPSSAMGR